MKKKLEAYFKVIFWHLLKKEGRKEERQKRKKEKFLIINLYVSARIPSRHFPCTA